MKVGDLVKLAKDGVGIPSVTLGVIASIDENGFVRVVSLADGGEMLGNVMALQLATVEDARLFGKINGRIIARLYDPS